MHCEKFKGNHYEIGRQIGEKYGLWIERTVAFFVDYHQHEISESQIKKFADQWEALLKEKTPNLLEQLLGIRAGSGLAWHELLAMNFRFWNTLDQMRREKFPGAFEAKGESGCTNIAYQTKDDGVVLGGSLDDIQLTWHLAKFYPKDGYNHIVTTWVGSAWACRGINEKGLAVGSSDMSINGIDYPWDKRFSDFALKIILEQSGNVTDALELLKKMGPFKGLSIMVADSQGDYRLIESSVAGFEVHEPKNNSLFCVNHVKSETLKKKMESMSYIHNPNDWSKNREVYLNKCFSDSSIQLTLDHMKELLAHHDNYPDSMCHRLAAYVTLALPQKYQDSLFVANGPSCRKKYEKITL